MELELYSLGIAFILLSLEFSTLCLLIIISRYYRDKKIDMQENLFKEIMLKMKIMRYNKAVR